MTFSIEIVSIELTGLIGFQNLSSKFNNALDVPPQGFYQLPIVPEYREAS